MSFIGKGAVYVGDPRSGVVYRIQPAVEHDAGTGLPAHHAAQWLARLASGLGGRTGHRNGYHGACAGSSAGAVCAAECLRRAVRHHQADGGALSGLSGGFPAQARRKLTCCERACGIAASALLWPDLSAGPADQFAQSQGSAFLPSLCAPVHRSRCAAEGAGLHRAGLHLQPQRHDLVPSAGVLDRLCESQGETARPGGNLAQPFDGGPFRRAWYQVGHGVIPKRRKSTIEKGVSHRWDTPLSALQQND